MKWTNGAISMYHRAKKNVFLESVSFLDDMEVQKSCSLPKLWDQSGSSGDRPGQLIITQYNQLFGGRHISQSPRDSPPSKQFYRRPGALLTESASLSLENHEPRANKVCARSVGLVPWYFCQIYLQPSRSFAQRNWRSNRYAWIRRPLFCCPNASIPGLLIVPRKRQCQTYHYGWSIHRENKLSEAFLCNAAASAMTSQSVQT